MPLGTNSIVEKPNRLEIECRRYGFYILKKFIIHISSLKQMARPLKDYVNIGPMLSEWVFGNLAFVFFLFFLGVVYIANANFAERQVRKIQTLEKDIKDLKWRYNAAKADVMFNTKQSEVERIVAPFGLQSSNTRTKRIVIEIGRASCRERV